MPVRYRSASDLLTAARVSRVALSSTAAVAALRLVQVRVVDEGRRRFHVSPRVRARAHSTARAACSATSARGSLPLRHVLAQRLERCA